MFIWNEICQKVFDVSNIMVSAPSVLNYTSVWIYKKIALQRRIQYRSKFIAEVQLYKSDLCGSMKQDVTREITSESLVILWGVSAGLSPFPPSRYTFYWMYTWEQWTETNLPSLILNVTLWRYHSWIYCHLRQLTPFKRQGILWPPYSSDFNQAENAFSEVKYYKTCWNHASRFSQPRSMHAVNISILPV